MRLVARADDKSPKSEAAGDDASATAGDDSKSDDAKSDDAKADEKEGAGKKANGKEGAAKKASGLISGPQVGDELGAFQVEKLAGAGNDNVDIGGKLCYRCMLGDRPVIMVFTSDLTPPWADLITALDKKVKDNGDEEAGVVHRAAEWRATKS